MRRQNQIAWLAWHIAALSRVKKLPKLETMQVKKASPHARQTWQQQLAVMTSMQTSERRRAAALKKAKGK